MAAAVSAWSIQLDAKTKDRDKESKQKIKKFAKSKSKYYVLPWQFMGKAPVPSVHACDGGGQSIHQRDTQQIV